jgi:hypothetical protein
MALRSLKTELKTMTRIARSPSGPNPRRLAATGSPNGGATRPSIGGVEMSLGKFEASFVMPCLKTRV